MLFLSPEREPKALRQPVSKGRLSWEEDSELETKISFIASGLGSEGSLQGRGLAPQTFTYLWDLYVSCTEDKPN